MEQRLQKLKEKILFTNPFEDKKYIIECKKCGCIFDYGYEDMRIEMTRDMSGRKRITRDKIVICPNCSRDYDFGYESKNLK
ncbi:MAG: hypothetical protein HFJ50_06570 [Clostridia bacterium]|nr:hypothetical protein [Clostridia bacterium]